MKPTRADTDRFWSKVNKNQTECWLWTGTMLPNGYGVIKLAGKNAYAHRLSYLLVNGYIPTEIDHLCKVKRCVNPNHLQDVTRSVNMVRAYGGRCRRGHRFTGQQCYTCKQQAWLNRTDR